MSGQTFKKIIITEKEVNDRIDEMAKTIMEKYGDKRPLFVCLLHGGLPFASKLMFSIAKHYPAYHPELDTMIVSTYDDGREGKLSKIVTDLSPTSKVKGRTVLLLDDVLDEGHTASFSKKHLLESGAEEVVLVVLLEKEKDRPKYPTAEMYGFKGPDVWLTGMGMDDAQLGTDGNRWMSFIATAKDVEK